MFFGSSQVVGWPPIRVYRKNSLVNQSRSSTEDGIDINQNDAMKMDGNSSSSTAKNNQEKGHGKSSFVKVNMDGVPIGRKVDLNAHVSYETLAQALEDMFHRPFTISELPFHFFSYFPFCVFFFGMYVELVLPLFCL